jgi:hypothetical protein
MIVNLEELSNEVRLGFQYEAQKIGQTEQEFADALVIRQGEGFYASAKAQDQKTYNPIYELSLQFPAELRVEQAVQVYQKALELGIPIPPEVQALVDSMQET